MRKLPEISRSISVPSKGQVTTPKSRQRKRSEKLAIAYLNFSIPLPAGARRKAGASIRNSQRPMLQAKQIIRAYREAPIEGSGRPDFSDVQEIKVKLIRKAGVIDTPQQSLLKKLDLMVARGCTRAEFKKLAGIILTMPQALPKKVREAERLQILGLGPRYDET